jgi:hypothetical protein
MVRKWLRGWKALSFSALPRCRARIIPRRSRALQVAGSWPCEETRDGYAGLLASGSSHGWSYASERRALVQVNTRYRGVNVRGQQVNRMRITATPRKRGASLGEEPRKSAAGRSVLIRRSSTPGRRFMRAIMLALGRKSERWKDAAKTWGISYNRTISCVTTWNWDERRKPRRIQF